MPSSLLFQATTTFGAGVLASLSPCVYPLLPITVGFVGSRGSGGTGRALGLFVLGQSVTFALMGWVTVQLGETLGFASESGAINIALGAFVLLMGVFSLRGSLPAFLVKGGDRAQAFLSRGAYSGRPGSWAPLALGAGAALVASPCTSPILGGVLTLIASAGTALRGSLLMFAYALGFSGMLALAAAGLLNLRRLPRSGPWLIYLHRASIAILFACGFYYLYRGVASHG
jgi:cytochrome c biogenesis protein CcdA